MRFVPWMTRQEGPFLVNPCHRRTGNGGTQMYREDPILGRVPRPMFKGEERMEGVGDRFNGPIGERGCGRQVSSPIKIDTTHMVRI